MRRYFCDRCGKEVPYEDKRYITGQAHKPVYQRHHLIFERLKDEGEREYELCKDCQESFYDWWQDVVREVDNDR